MSRRSQPYRKGSSLRLGESPVWAFPDGQQRLALPGEDVSGLLAVGWRKTVEVEINGERRWLPVVDEA